MAGRVFGHYFMGIVPCHGIFRPTWFRVRPQLRTAMHDRDITYGQTGGMLKAQFRRVDAELPVYPVQRAQNLLVGDGRLVRLASR